MKETIDRIEWLDSLKGIACLIVVSMHILSKTEYGAYANGCGKIGVWLFMISAGYMLLYPYIVDENKSFNICDIPKYYCKRIIKIYPGYVLALGLMLFVGIIDFKETIEGIALISGPYHLWFVPVIMQFYVISPLFLMVFIWFRKKIYIFVLVLVTVLVLDIYLFRFEAYPENSNFLLWYLSVFIMGMFLAIIQNKGGLFGDSMFVSNVVYDLIWTIGICLIILSTPIIRHGLFGYELDNYLQNKYFYISICWILICIGVGGSHRLENAVFLKRIVPYCYEIYLFHFVFVMCLMGKMASVPFAITVLILTLILSYVWRSISLHISMHIYRHLKF